MASNEALNSAPTEAEKNCTEASSVGKAATAESAAVQGENDVDSVAVVSNN
jgi:hypothetical protein